MLEITKYPKFRIYLLKKRLNIISSTFRIQAEPKIYVLLDWFKDFGEDYTTLITHLSPNVPLMEKPRAWFSLAKSAKSNCGKVILQ